MVSEGKFIVAFGPVIVESGKLLVSKDNKDDFYKLIGGTVREGEGLENACVRKAKEACGAEIEIVKPLSPNIFYENPQTSEKMTIGLINYLVKLKNLEGIKPIPSEQDLKWVDIEEIKKGEGNVSPNVKALVEKEF